MTALNAEHILSYLSLPNDYKPSPSELPIDFLKLHLRHLPPHLLNYFPSVTSPAQRTAITTIRNRRAKYASSNPSELAYNKARRKWPRLAQALGQSGGGENLSRTIPAEERDDERAWADREFLGGQKQQVGKLGALLGDYAEEREAERMRAERREQAAREKFVPEEESESEEDGEMVGQPTQEAEVDPLEEKAYFERLVKEKYIYGLLDNADYDAVDWNDTWDEQIDRDEEERWFDEEEPGEEGEGLKCALVDTEALC